jgi:hypothetical protein
MKRIIAALLIALLLDAPAWAVVVYDAASSSACDGCTGDSWSHTTGAGSNTFMLCAANVYDAATGTTIDAFTYNSLALTAKDSAAASSEFFSAVYKRTAPTTGANTVAITYSQAVNSTTGCLTFSGVDQATPDGTSVTDSNSSGSLSASITIPANGAGASFAVYNEDGVSCTDSTSGQTERFQVCNGDFGVQGMGSTTTSTGSVAMTWTLNAANTAAMVAVPISESAGAPAAAGSSRIMVVE